MEVVIFAQTLPNIKSLERLTFKVIQCEIYIESLKTNSDVDIQEYQKAVYFI